MQEAVLKIKELGVPPLGFNDDYDENFDEEKGRIWEDWIDAICMVERPVSWEEAEVLIRCCPVEDMAEVEWTMLHCIESVVAGGALEVPEQLARFRDLIGKCNSEMMKEMLRSRLENYLDNKR